MILAKSRGPDRRRLPRMRLECSMELSLESTGESLEGFACTVSGGGLSFESDRPLEVGTRVNILVAPALRLTSPLRGVVEVRRCVPTDSGRGLPYAVAGAFTQLDAA